MDPVTLSRVSKHRDVRLRVLGILLALWSTLLGGCAPQGQLTPGGDARPPNGPVAPTASVTAGTEGDHALAPTEPALPSATPAATATPTRVSAPSPTPTTGVPTVTPAPSRSPVALPLACPLGLGLRTETAPLILAYQDRPAFVMTGSFAMAARYFPELEGWTRVLGAPSLPTLEQKAERAELEGVDYEALAYGLETGPTTPEEEWQDVVASTRSARAVADRYDKLLVMGPGFRLMMQNEDLVPVMGVYSGVWMFQTQSFQKLHPPGADYRREVAEVVDLIRAENPDLSVWAQITLPPDRAPSADEWLAYRHSIADLVDGVYVGVYTWQTSDAGQLVATLEAILAAVCGAEEAGRASSPGGG
jgi:hypothetical protein